MKLENHPSPVWTRSTRNIDRDIRFKGLTAKDAQDHDLCFEWEFNRTKYFLDEDFRLRVNQGRKDLLSLIKKLERLKTQKRKSELISAWEQRGYDNLMFQDYFPFYSKDWPSKPYLSKQSKLRQKWTRSRSIGRSLLENPLRDRYPRSPQNLNTEHPTEDPYVVDGYWAEGYTRAPLSSVPIELHIGATWKKENLVRAVEHHANEILELVKFKKAELEKKGNVFEKPIRRHPMRTLRKNLKMLGLLRLELCCGHSWERMEKIYNEKDSEMSGSYFSYEDKNDYIKEQKKFLEKYPLR